MYTVAMQYRIWPFSSEFLEAWESPYARAFLLASVEKDTPEKLLIKVLTEIMPEYLKSLIDIHGKSLYNLILAANTDRKKKPRFIKSLFEQRKKKLPPRTAIEPFTGELIQIVDSFD